MEREAAKGRGDCQQAVRHGWWHHRVRPKNRGSPPARWGSLDFIRVACLLSSSSSCQPRALDLSGYCRTSTASARSQWALPDLNTSSSRSQWALLDLNRELQISVGTAGPNPRAPDLSASRQGHTWPVPQGPCRSSINERESTTTSSSRLDLQGTSRALEIERRRKRLGSVEGCCQESGRYIGKAHNHSASVSHGTARFRSSLNSVYSRFMHIANMQPKFYIGPASKHVLDREARKFYKWRPTSLSENDNLFAWTPIPLFVRRGDGPHTGVATSPDPRKGLLR